MERPVGTTWFGSALVALALLAGTPGVHGASARIVFSGAVVEPTCSTEGVPMGSASRFLDGSAAARLSCGRTATDPGRSYSRRVTRLTAADMEHDQLLAYFASYAGRGDEDEATVKVVVHTYD